MSDSTRDPLDASLRALQARLSEEMRGQWRRDLPFDELISDRWERARRLGFGDGASVYQSSYIYGDVSVGERTWIGPMTVLDGTGGLTIGRTCSISSGVQIYTHDSVKWALSGGEAKYEVAPVTIGDCCYIGSQSVIGKGVRIGAHVLVGACSFVNRDLPDFSIAVGTPCRIVGRVRLDGGEVRLEFTKG